MRSVLGKPESQVDAHFSGLEMISAKYTLRGPAVYPNNYEVPIIKRITKGFGAIAEELAEEVSLAFDEH